MRELYGRRNEVVVGTKLFDGDYLSTTFNVPFDDGPEPNVGNVELYNLSDNSINSMKNGQPCYINAGYKESVGSIILGTIKNLRTEWRGVDKITMFDIVDSGDGWLKTKVKKSYKAGTTAYIILDDLLKLTGLKVSNYILTFNKVYRSGKTFDGTLYDALLEIVKDCGNVFTVNKNTIYIKKKYEGVGYSIKIDQFHGLIGHPSRVEKDEVVGTDVEGNDITKTFQGWKVTTLLLHKITTNSIIEIDSATARGFFRVESGRHISNDSRYYTELEVYPL